MVPHPAHVPHGLVSSVDWCARLCLIKSFSSWSGPWGTAIPPGPFLINNRIIAFARTFVNGFYTLCAIIM